LNKTMKIIQTIDVFVNCIYIHHTQWKKQQVIGSFWENNFFQKFDEKMKSKMAAMRWLIMKITLLTLSVLGHLATIVLRPFSGNFTMSETHAVNNSAVLSYFFHLHK
jgi:hypothetical protein